MLLPGTETRVVELRVHGVMGTDAATLVTAVAAVDVAGDGVGRLVRPADRLQRPAPGPVLRAEGRSVPRVVEGYLWGAMTSGGWAKAAWALLFPFSLANMAHWMLPPVPAGHPVGRPLLITARALVRVAALLLTALLVTQLAVVTLDLVAVQCLAPGVDCLSWVPERARAAYPFRQAVGLLPVLAAVFVLHRISRVRWSPERRVRQVVREDLPGRRLIADPDTPSLRLLHLVIGLLAVSVLVLGGPVDVPEDPLARVLWCAALGLAGLCVLATLLLDDPRGAGGSLLDDVVRRAFTPLVRRALLGLAVVLLVTAGLTSPLAVEVAGTGPTVEVVVALLFGVVVLFGVVLLPLALIGRRAYWAARPRELRPWAGGWMAAPVLSFGVLLGGGFGAGLAIAVGQLIGTGTRLPAGYEPVALLWGAAAALGVVVGAVLAVVAGVRLLRGSGYAEAALLHPDRPAEAVRAWRIAGWQRRNLHRVVLVASSVLTAGAAGATALRLTGFTSPWWADLLSAFGVLALGALAGMLLRAVYNAARQPATGRKLGVIADLASFWPRDAHPAVPPCYALKVVPELTARVVEHLKDPGTRVVLTGHSQGSLLVAVTASRLLAVLPPQDAERIGIVTAGSQLQWAYPRAFPSIVSHPSLVNLFGELDGRWRSVCRGTDPIGGAVATWARQVYAGNLLGTGFRPDGTVGPLTAAVRSPHGALVLGGDHFVADPMAGPLPGRRWTPGTLAHGDYPADPEWDRAVAMAAGLDPDASGRGGLVWPPRPSAAPRAEAVRDKDERTRPKTGLAKDRGTVAD
ncbi:hypothetical protein ACOBQX_12680 [Actinokineospora sp. G85]|uniref:hypothetical protein n=1 Tax=Actinokineospora sp. G85 TaxID=3406626 RepID=UPI003C72FC37